MLKRSIGFLGTAALVLAYGVGSICGQTTTDTLSATETVNSAPVADVDAETTETGAEETITVTAVVPVETETDITTEPATAAEPAAVADPAQTGMAISDEESTTTDTVVTTAAATLMADEESTAGVTGELPGPAAAETQTSVTLPEGVIYQVLRSGSGDAAGSTSTLLIHYTLSTTDGTKIESSKDAVFPLPFDFTVGEGKAIRGMEMGTAGMRVGEIRKLFVPARLGYGARGMPPKIQPNTDLVFEVELVDLK